MAHVPDKKRIKEIQAITDKAIDQKLISQHKKGKTFKPTGAGVIPEKTWKGMKK